MSFKEKIMAFLLLPSSRTYLKKIIFELKNKDYKQVLEQTPNVKFKATKQESLVKSYFWAARTIKDCRCLPRSIALYHHMKALGYDVKHKIGVNKTEKLNAHSWVELNDEPLNEHPDLYQRFTVLELTNDTIKATKLT